MSPAVFHSRQRYYLQPLVTALITLFDQTRASRGFNYNRTFLRLSSFKAARFFSHDAPPPGPAAEYQHIAIAALSRQPQRGTTTGESGHRGNGQASATLPRLSGEKRASDKQTAAMQNDQ